MKACPYGVRRFTWADPVWPRGMDATLTPFASVRPKGVVEKCTFCAHRLVMGNSGVSGVQAGTDGFVTACAQACPTGAIEFGEVAALLRGRETFVLLAEQGTGPQVHYLTRRTWVRGGQ